MSSYPVNEILDLLCRRLRWVEASTMHKVLEGKTSASSNLSAAIRYLCNKGMIERHVVNCSEALTQVPILTSSTKDPLESATALRLLTTQSQGEWHATQFYCASRIAAGLYGSKYSQPNSVLEWYAHRRMANAFLHHLDESNLKHCKWWAVEVKSDQPKILLAVFNLTWLCVPFEVNQRTLNRILIRIRKKGFRYEVW